VSPVRQGTALPAGVTRELVPLDGQPELQAQVFDGITEWLVRRKMGP
jgi:hypothetical protein